MTIYVIARLDELFIFMRLCSAMYLLIADGMINVPEQYLTFHGGLRHQ
jgi:hypothetical protein